MFANTLYHIVKLTPAFIYLCINSGDEQNSKLKSVHRDFN